ncbi:hypothetical protein VFPPC_12333 [Pochonia chlamydosporia 170]|uniref:DnaJ domain-containing protein n=1 Tax=Pochonia chlamydosporia 170 TaxID=1380566 RepID=A0A179EXH3_METCM|nr:hypothetical protein VFPPC_12333 [Pochonia chlamydosporia 170]OAQ57553.1 hypothetical protein VFPPC_12333 [Pochonia chlamydosporia 170]
MEGPRSISIILRPPACLTPIVAPHHVKYLDDSTAPCREFQPDRPTEKAAQTGGRLLTPEPTPGVEDGRVAADLARKAAETRHEETPASPAQPATGTDATEIKSDNARQEIERILLCADNSYAEILAVSSDPTEEEVVTAWKRLGCMLHPHYCLHNDSKAVYKKVRRAAGQMGVDQTFIDEVNLWDGKEVLTASQLDGTSEDIQRRSYGQRTAGNGYNPHPSSGKRQHAGEGLAIAQMQGLCRLASAANL